MKISAVLMLVACLQVQAHGFGQQITLSEKGVSLEKVFRSIYQQTGYQFIYRDEALQGAGKIDIDVKNATLQEVLDICFRNQPLEYVIGNGTIIVRPKPISPLPQAGEAPTPPIDLRGLVIDSTGLPLVGANIQIKGTSILVSTDTRGIFALRGLDDHAELIVSYTGYQTKVVPVEKSASSTMVIRLSVSHSPLDDVQVIAYGTTSRRFNTGDVSSVTSADIEKQPVADPIVALQGRVAGVNITQTSGVPGTAVNVTIRGATSLFNGTQPLYVIDGVPFFAGASSNPNLSSLNGGGFNSGLFLSPFSLIDPNDIERIDVLKDADATAIYGTRGANGAILITTKKAKIGKTSLDVNVQQGFGQVNHFIPMLDLSQYLALRREALNNDGIAISDASAPDLVSWDTTKSIDWQKKYMGGTASYTDAQASLQGGSLQTRLGLSAGYHRETSVSPGNANYQRATVHLTGEHNSQDGRFNATISTEYTYQLNNLTGVYSSGNYTLAPDQPIYNPDGSLYWSTITSNPEAYLYTRDITRTNSLISSLDLRYTILHGLEAKIHGGFTKSESDQNIQEPAITQNPTTSTPSNSALFADIDNQSYLLEPQLDWKTRVARGKLDVLAGSTIQSILNNSVGLIALNYSNAALLGAVPGAASYIGTGVYSQYKYNSLYARANYDWQGKYILNGTLRRDGSSRFGPDYSFGNFGSIGGAWIFSSESFLKDNHWLSFGKLRGSYGLTGNDQIGDYLYLALFNAPFNNSPYDGQSVLDVTTPSNPAIHWETTKKLDLGLDLGFLKDRFLLTVNYYRNQSGNQLGTLTLPAQTGFTTFTDNFPATIRTNGLEFEVTTKNIVAQNFSWTTNFNLTIPRNKLVRIDPAVNNFSGTLPPTGYPVGELQGYIYKGIDPATGNPLFLSAAKDTPTANPGTADLKYYGNTLPIWYGGITNDFRYKGWDLSFFIRVMHQMGDIIPQLQPGALGNVPAFYAQGIWQPGDLHARFPAASTNYDALSNLENSNYYFGDNSFVKLQNISLAYNLSGPWLKKSKITQCNVFAHAENLYTWTKNKYLYDPETGTGVPPLRVITFGIHCSF